MKKGFTLLELIVVIIIIGILGSIGFTQYARVVEKGRVAEAKVLLGQVRGSQEAYELEMGVCATLISDLAVGVPTACTVTHYFQYTTSQTTGTATRCSASGKTPNASATYTVTLGYNSGAWGGSAGYY
jgi:prepilin-type N-terminal cleavage/methylation domain-containing protein